MLAGKQPAAEPGVKAGEGEAGTGEGSEHAGKALSSEGAPKRPGGEGTQILIECLLAARVFLRYKWQPKAPYH